MEFTTESLYDPLFIKHDRMTTVEVYLEDLSESAQIHADAMAAQLTQSGKDPLPQTVVTIPVAAHVEARQIIPALAEYARQAGNEPFAVHLFLNSPTSANDTEGIAHTADEIAEAQKLFPHLDIRITAAIHEDTTIGGLRKMAWDSTLYALYGQGLDVATAIGINHDIDLIKLSPHYIANVQAYYKDLNASKHPTPLLPIKGTQAKHYYSADHPNISRVAFFSDLATRLAGGNYEASKVIPFATYASKGGFPEDASTHETRLLTAEEGLIPGTRLETSMRRYIDRLQTHPIYEIWTDDSFGPNDSCRMDPVLEDIDSDQLRYDIMPSTPPNAFAIARHALNLETSETKSRRTVDSNAVSKKIERAQTIGRAFEFGLRKVIGIEEAANYTRDHVFSISSLTFMLDAMLTVKYGEIKTSIRQMTELVDSLPIATNEGKDELQI